MSAKVLGHINQNSVALDIVDSILETVDKLKLMEKCGEVFLDRHLGNLIYLCNLCEDQFGGAEDFANHIADSHVSIDSFITYEPSESDAEADINEEPDPIEKSIQEEEDDEFNASEYEFLIKHEADFLDENSSESTKEKQFDFADEDIKEDLTIEEVQEEPDEEPEIDPKAFEINFDEEELPHSKVFKEDPSDPSDEEILRSKLSCKFCGEQFDYVKKMRQHDCGLNLKKKKHLCDVCGKEFKKKSGLDIHSLIHRGEKPHKCDICGTAYACKQNLIVHVRRHTGEKPFKCDYCDSQFVSSTERKSHMRTHTGDKPFVCELCGKRHSSSSQLTEHMHRHLDIRNHACEICDKRFRNSYNLRMHRQTHETGPRLYNCNECSASFKTNSSLLQHAKIHAKVKKYVCKICGRAFAQHPGLYSHMKSHASIN